MSTPIYDLKYALGALARAAVAALSDQDRADYIENHIGSRCAICAADATAKEGFAAVLSVAREFRVCFPCLLDAARRPDGESIALAERKRQRSGRTGRVFSHAAELTA